MGEAAPGLNGAGRRRRFYLEATTARRLITMNRVVLGTSIALLSIGSAQAALVSRMGGQAYYDTILDVTWLADANFAKTSGYDEDGFLSWPAALAWIDWLNTNNHLGASNWRLPAV